MFFCSSIAVFYRCREGSVKCFAIAILFLFYLPACTPSDELDVRGTTKRAERGDIEAQFNIIVSYS